MATDRKISKNITLLLVYGRPPLVFAGMICALAVMMTRNPFLYLSGGILLFASMVFDLVDGWFAARFTPNASLAELADRVMDRIVYSIVFPLLAAGMMWRLLYVSPSHSRIELMHAIFVLILCVTVLIRDNFAHFMRGVATRYAQEPELRELTRLRTIVAAPLGFVLYAHAFYIPPQGAISWTYSWISYLGNLPLRNLFIIEIIFLVINFGSIASYSRKYGRYYLDDLCFGDDLLRRRILAIFPNSLTIMNAMMGLLAVFFADQGKMHESYLLLIGAAVFDKLDGAMARRLGLTEPLPDASDRGHISFGGILDDIADGMSFCIAPAWIFYICLSGNPDPAIRSLPIGIAALAYALAGFARLVYFTIDKNAIPGFFKGMPTPAAALFVTAPLILLCPMGPAVSEMGRFVAFFSCGLMFFAAVLMNLYPVKYMHMGRYMDRNPWFTWTIVLFMLFFVFTPYFAYIAFFQMALYVLSPLVTWRVDPETAAMEGRRR